jgi:hypothetical protein
MAFGDVLRGLGSVLNPAVAQEVAKEDEQNRGAQQQVGMLRLRQQMEQQSPEYQAKVEALKNEKLFREEVAGAGGDMAKVAGLLLSTVSPTSR